MNGAYPIDYNIRARSTVINNKKSQISTHNQVQDTSIESSDKSDLNNNLTTPTMPLSKSKFQANDSVDGLYKTSLFKNLFKDRKLLMDGYPCGTKGLQFPDPTLKCGNVALSFKTNAVVDKMVSKFDNQEFIACYKKSTDKFDVSYKSQYAPGLYGLLKYEERGSEAPHYVFGCDYVAGPLALNSKLNLGSGNFKASAMVCCDDILRSLKIAADCKVSECNSCQPDLRGTLFNLGASYSSTAGLTALAYSGAQKSLTLNHSLQLDKCKNGLFEVVIGTDGTTNPKAAIGLGWQVDREHQLRCRINDAAQVQVCVKKDFNSSVSILAACCVDLQSKGLQTQLLKPSFGFKIVNKA